MQGIVLALALASIAMSAVAQVLLRLGMTGGGVRDAIAQGSPIGIIRAVLLSPGVMGELLLYGLGTILWLAVLARAELSQAYPFVGLSFVLTAAMGVILVCRCADAHALTPVRIAGIALIVAGVVLVGRS